MQKATEIQKELDLRLENSPSGTWTDITPSSSGTAQKLFSSIVRE
ncbi:hypothetical protein JOD44_000389 [Salimicrobium jeotgali]|nr:hypothetical protein [Salimicrobium jeotgali]